MWSSRDWVEDMIMVGSFIMDKAGMNDQSAAGYYDEQADMNDHNATIPNQRNAEQADTTEYSMEQAGMNDPKPAK